jgi:hypothetical protein
MCCGEGSYLPLSGHEAVCQRASLPKRASLTEAGVAHTALSKGTSMHVASHLFCKAPAHLSQRWSSNWSEAPGPHLASHSSMLLPCRAQRRCCVDSSWHERTVRRVSAATTASAASSLANCDTSGTAVRSAAKSLVGSSSYPQLSSMQGLATAAVPTLLPRAAAVLAPLLPELLRRGDVTCRGLTSGYCN